MTSKSKYLDVSASVKLGGAWKELYEEASRHREEAARRVEEAEELRGENSDLRQRLECLAQSHRSTLSSLTHHETSHLELEGIVSSIRTERDELAREMASMRESKEDSDRQRLGLEARLAELQRTLDECRASVIEKDKLLMEVMMNQDRLVEALARESEGRASEERAGESLGRRLALIQRALLAKDRQLFLLSKEKHDLLQWSLKLEKSLLPCQRKAAKLSSPQRPESESPTPPTVKEKENDPMAGRQRLKQLATKLQASLARAEEEKQSLRLRLEQRRPPLPAPSRVPLNQSNPWI